MERTRVGYISFIDARRTSFAYHQDSVLRSRRITQIDDIAAGRDEVIGRHAHRHECEGEEVVDRGQRKQSPEHFSTSGVDSTAKMSRKSFYFPYFWSLQRQRHFADRAGLVGVEPFLSRQACREDLRRD